MALYILWESVAWTGGATKEDIAGGIEWFDKSLSEARTEFR